VICSCFRFRDINRAAVFCTRLSLERMQHRIKYKILLYTFKALNNLAPVYLQELVNAYQPSRALRSEDLQLLKAPRIRTKTYGERRLDKPAATLWNSLPQNIRHVQSVK
jgi:hypothetical protein